MDPIPIEIVSHIADACDPLDSEALRTICKSLYKYIKPALYKKENIERIPSAVVKGITHVSTQGL